MPRKTFDPECHRLATHFLAGDEAAAALRESETNELAQAIQDAIEAWLDYRDGDKEKPDAT